MNGNSPVNTLMIILLPVPIQSDRMKFAQVSLMLVATVERVIPAKAGAVVMKRREAG